MKLHSPLLIVCLLLQVLPLAAQSDGKLYYSGLADNGWQMFSWDFKLKKETQLTHSPGDKRLSTWIASTQMLVYKDAIGRICKLSASGKEEVLVKGVRTCAHFTVSRDGKDIYYTRLLANNPLRQSLWHASASDDFSDPQLIFRMPRGSIRNVCLSPSGKTIAMSHVWRDNEERLLLLDLSLVESSPDKAAVSITPALVTAAFPRYSADGATLYFAQRVNRGNYDLFSYDLENKKSQLLFDTPATSEFYPSPSADAHWLFYEVRKNARIHHDSF